MIPEFTQVAALTIGALMGLGADFLMALPDGVLDPRSLGAGWRLVTAATGYRVIFGRWTRPLSAARVNLPTSTAIDARLVTRSALFGVGWGILGFCPGAAIPALGFAPWPTALFLTAMGGGIALARWLQTRPPRQTLRQE